MIKQSAYFIFILFYPFFTVYAQDTEIYKEGDIYFEVANYKEALKKYSSIENVYLKDVFLKYKIGVCYLESSNYKHKSIDYFNFCIKYKSSKIPDDVYFYLGKAYHYGYKFLKAINMFNTYLESPNSSKLRQEEARRMITICENATYAYNHPLKDIVAKPMSFPVNSSYDDIAPVIANRGLLLVTASNKPHNTIYLIKNVSEVLYSNSTKNKNYSIYFSYPRGIDWSFPESLKINTNKKNVIPLSFNNSGDQMLISISTDLDDQTFYIIYNKGNNNWSSPKKLDNTINSIYKEKGGHFSNNGQVIYFASNRPGGYGGYDIYKSIKQGKEWLDPENLGENINTIYDEINPYIHVDHRTLYFSSNGHNTMGGFDIFRSRQDGYSWIKAQNLGYPLNTPFNETHYTQIVEDTNVYIASDRFNKNSIGNNDIIEVVRFNRNLPVTMVNGIINIFKDKKQINVKLQVIDKETNKLQKYVYNPTDESGRFFMILRNNKHYTIKILDGFNNYIYETDISIPKNSYNYQLNKTIHINSIQLFDQIIGERTDITESSHKVIRDLDLSLSKGVQDIKYEALVLLMGRIIERADFLGLETINSLEEELFKPQKKKENLEDNYYTSMLDKIEYIIETTNTLALKDLNKIVERYSKTKFFHKDKSKDKKVIIDYNLKYKNDFSDITFEDKNNIEMLINLLKQDQSLFLEIKWTKNEFSQEDKDLNIESTLNSLKDLFETKELANNRYKLSQDLSQNTNQSFISPQYYQLYNLRFLILQQE